MLCGGFNIEMNRIESIRRLWSEVFGDSADYLDMYFDRVYRDEDALAIFSEDGNRLDSALLLQRYQLQYQGAVVQMGYIAGAMTRRSARGRGLMTRLVGEALAKARERGDMLVSLIPAHDWLYFFYDRLGFATVFYVDTQRFTSLHRFALPPEAPAFHRLDDPYAPAVLAAFERFERRRPCSVLHTKRDYLNILDDNRLDGGSFVAIADEQGEVAAMAWAVEEKADGLLTVTELLGRDGNARTAALAELRRQHPGKAFKVLAPPLTGGTHLESLGMARVVNPLTALTCVAKAHSDFCAAIRVRDRLLPQNDGVYLINDGTVSKLPYENAAGVKLDFDITAELLAKIMFSGDYISDIIDFPGERPTMRLMLQ